MAQLVFIFKIKKIFQFITKKVNKNNRKDLVIIKIIVI